MNVRDSLTTEEILEGFRAIIDGEYRYWRKGFPPSKRFADYEILLAVYKILAETVADMEKYKAQAVNEGLEKTYGKV